MTSSLKSTFQLNAQAPRDSIFTNTESISFQSIDTPWNYHISQKKGNSQQKTHLPTVPTVGFFRCYVRFRLCNPLFCFFDLRVHAGSTKGGASSDHRSSSLRTIKIIPSSLWSVRLQTEKHMWKKIMKPVKKYPSHHRGCISSLSKLMIPICFVNIALLQLKHSISKCLNRSRSQIIKTLVFRKAVEYWGAHSELWLVKTSVYVSRYIYICIYIYMGVSENSGTPKSSNLIGFFIINHPFWGTPFFGNTHMYISIYLKTKQSS